MSKMQIYDKDGRPVTRANGILQHGDTCRMPIMDNNSMPVHPQLQAAIDRAKITPKPHTVNVSISHNGSDAALAALDIANMTDAERDIHNREVMRDRRNQALDNRWRGKDHKPASPPTIDSNRALQQKIDAQISASSKFPMHRPGYRFADQARDPALDAQQNRIEQRDAKLENAWKDAAPAFKPDLADQIARPVDVKPTTPVKLPEGIHPADAKDKRISEAWRNA